MSNQVRFKPIWENPSPSTDSEPSPSMDENLGPNQRIREISFQSLLSPVSFNRSDGSGSSDREENPELNLSTRRTFDLMIEDNDTSPDEFAFTIECEDVRIDSRSGSSNEAELWQKRKSSDDEELESNPSPIKKTHLNPEEETDRDEFSPTILITEYLSQTDINDPFENDRKENECNLNSSRESQALLQTVLRFQPKLKGYIDNKEILLKRSISSGAAGITLEVERGAETSVLKVLKAPLKFETDKGIEPFLHTNHPSLVKIQELVFNPDAERKEIIAILMEKASGATLERLASFKQVKKQFVAPSYSPEVFFSIARELIKGLSYLKENRLLHRDIKPANILWDGETGQLKIVDYDLAVRLGSSSDYPPGQVGTVAYAAPEMSWENYSYPADAYSLGKVLDKLSKFVKWPPESETLQERTKATIDQLLLKEPNDRLAIERAVFG